MLKESHSRSPDHWHVPGEVSRVPDDGVPLEMFVFCCHGKSDLVPMSKILFSYYGMSKSSQSGFKF